MDSSNNGRIRNNGVGAIMIDKNRKAMFSNLNNDKLNEQRKTMFSNLNNDKLNEQRKNQFGKMLEKDRNSRLIRKERKNESR